MKHLNRRRRPARSGLTLLEILVVVVLIAVVVAVLLPTAHHSRDPANRVRCASNVRTIGQAMMMYSNENHGDFPRVIYAPGKAPVWGTGVTASNPFADANRPADNDITAALYLLIRTQEIGSEVFVCPVQNKDLSPEKDDFGGGGNTAEKRSNFTDWRKNLSYSLANPYPDAGAMVLGTRWNSTLTSEFALAADMNPGVGDGYDVTFPTVTSMPKEKQKANSRNHNGAGQNVLYGDMHVEFQQTAFAGMKNDNIYTVSGYAQGIDGPTTSKVIVGSPKGPHDSVLLPAYK